MPSLTVNYLEKHDLVNRNEWGLMENGLAVLPACNLQKQLNIFTRAPRFQKSTIVEAELEGVRFRQASFRACIYECLFS